MDARPGAFRQASSVVVLVLLLLSSLTAFSSDLRQAKAETTYSSLTYQMNITLSFDELQLGGLTEDTGTLTFSFTMVMATNPDVVPPPDLNGLVNATGTYSATAYSNGQEDCSGSGTYSGAVSANTNFQGGTVDFSGYGTRFNSYSNDCIADATNNVVYELIGSCFGGISGGPTNGACEEFPIQGGTATISLLAGFNSEEESYNKLTGSVQLALVASTVASTSSSSSASTTTTTATTTTSVSSTAATCTIAPTMPPPSDPREFAPATGGAAFRFGVTYTGNTPTYVDFQIAGTTAEVDASFDFNPASMVVSPINVIMQATTDNAPAGDYPLTVTASITDPYSGQVCTSETTVTLVVGQTIADFTLVAHQGPVTVAQPPAIPSATQGIQVTTGSGGTASVKVTPTPASGGTQGASATVDVGQNTNVRTYSRIIFPAETDIDLPQPAPCGGLVLYMFCARDFNKAWAGVGQVYSNALSVAQKKVTQVTQATLNAITCALAPSSSTAASACNTTAGLFLSSGQIHYTRTQNPATASSTGFAIFTYGAIVVPSGTEFTLSSQFSGNTTLTMLEGQAVVVDPFSQRVYVVNATQTLTIADSFAYANSFETGQSASTVLGEPDFNTNNFYVCSTCLATPEGLAFDSKGDLWVADSAASRVVEFTPPFANGMQESVVIGQPDFDTDNQTASQSGLSYPTNVVFDSSGDLWVADYANSRVLEFKPPFTTGMEASLVLGQPNFTSNAYQDTGTTGMDGPSGLAFDSKGDLWVSDLNRVLEFSPPFTNGMAASLEIGQPSFNSVNYAASSSSLNAPGGIAFDSKGDLWVADTYNNRTLEFVPPFKTGMSASLALGSESVNLPGTCGVTATGLCNPSGVSFDSKGDLWVADALDNRLVEFSPPFSTDMLATVAIGQPNLTTATSVPINSSSLTLSGPFGYDFANSAFDSSGNLWVTDPEGDRVLEFQYPLSVTTQDQVSSTSPGSVKWWDNTVTYEAAVGGNTYEVYARSNASISNLAFNSQQKSLSFETNGTGKGYVNATWPSALLGGTLYASIDGKQVQVNTEQVGTSIVVYLTFGPGTHSFVLSETSPVPEFPSLLVPTVLLTVLAVGAWLVRSTGRRSLDRGEPRSDEL